MRENHLSIKERRERSLRFCFGFYCMPAGDEDGSLQNGLAMVRDPRLLDQVEKQEITSLIESNPEIRETYLSRFKLEGRLT